MMSQMMIKEEPVYYKISDAAQKLRIDVLDLRC